MEGLFFFYLHRFSLADIFLLSGELEWAERSAGAGTMGLSPCTESRKSQSPRTQRSCRSSGFHAYWNPASRKYPVRTTTITVSTHAIEMLTSVFFLNRIVLKSLTAASQKKNESKRLALLLASLEEESPQYQVSIPLYAICSKLFLTICVWLPKKGGTHTSAHRVHFINQLADQQHRGSGGSFRSAKWIPYHECPPHPFGTLPPIPYLLNNPQIRNSDNFQRRSWMYRLICLRKAWPMTTKLCLKSAPKLV